MGEIDDHFTTKRKKHKKHKKLKKHKGEYMIGESMELSSVICNCMHVYSGDIHMEYVLY